MGLVSSYADPAIWMRDIGDHYEYICAYVDDLLIASKNPKTIVDELFKEYIVKPCNYLLDEGAHRFRPALMDDKFLTDVSQYKFDEGGKLSEDRVEFYLAMSYFKVCDIVGWEEMTIERIYEEQGLLHSYDMEDYEQTTL